MRRWLLVVGFLLMVGVGIVLLMANRPHRAPFIFLQGRKPFTMAPSAPALGQVEAEAQFYSFQGDARRFLPQAIAELKARGFFRVPGMPGPKSTLFLRNQGDGEEDGPLRVVIYQDLHLGPRSAIRPGANPGWITVEVLSSKT